MARKQARQAPTMNLGELADALYAKEAEITEANAKVAELKKQADDLEASVFAALDAAGTDTARGKRGSVSITEAVRPQLADYDAFCGFVLKRKALHLFERRISAKAYAEMKETLGTTAMPGVTEFKYRRLNVRKVTT